ncbi:hypothetical protein EZ449_03705 [Pedobacter frigidisoli]|uniref:Uncharacterized protein n=1 Tax=Pedobacter frigidisoli TaxID=2530455 RepID=A0A4R0P5H1_9SPHI|nr:hypothetical protein [Pedobacter frigidisoli]TCD12133.1 hypothetical protein EZ449_03705 [Pedobacter frigidisoli]
MEKLTKFIKRSSINKIQLENIRIGDFVSDEYGKSGKVDNIEKVHCHRELHYYFHLGKSGTILIIL